MVLSLFQYHASLLDPRYTAVGIAHIYYFDGTRYVHFWAEEFGTTVSNTNATAANDSQATVTLNDYKSKYEAVKTEFEKQYGPLTLNGFNSDEWLKDPWPWDIVE